MRLLNLTTGQQVASQVRRPRSLLARTKGFIGRKQIAPEEGLWLDRCCAVHTIGMLVALDLVFLDGDQRIMEMRAAVPPLQPAIVCKGARVVVELPVGTIGRHDLLNGDLLDLAT